jgi:hypothetical protein
MAKIFAFLKLWWGKLFGLTAKKNFVYIFPLAAFLVLAIIPSSLLSVIFLVVEIIAIVSNTQGEK